MVITEHEMKTMSEVGVDFTSSKRTTLKLVPPASSNLTQRRSAIVDNNEADSTVTNPLDDDDLALGASASPVETNSSPIPLPLFSDEPTSTSHSETISLYPCKRISIQHKIESCKFNFNFIFFPISYSVIVAIIMRLRRSGQPSNDLLFK